MIEDLKLLLILSPIWIFLYFWVKQDFQNKRNITSYDEKGNKIESFGEWLDGGKK